MNVRPPAARSPRRQRWSALAPFIAAFGLALVLGWLPTGGPEEVPLMVLATVLILGTGVSLVGGVWSRVPELATLVPVVTLCVAVHLLRAASGGGSSAGYGSLLLIPVIWQSLRRGRLTLDLTILVVSAANIIAVLFLASPVSTSAQWRSVILFTVVAVTMGHTIHKLVSDRARLFEQITRLAGHDALTGLPNRRTWEDHLPQAVAEASTTALPLTVALLDLDHFKAYNDRLGHTAGDGLLSAAATAWETELRTGDLLARWGGEEFALLLPSTDAHDAERVLSRLLAVTPSGQTFSAGYTVTHLEPGATPDLDQMLHDADQAMYAAKAAGRARSACAQDLPVVTAPR